MSHRSFASAVFLLCVGPLAFAPGCISASSDFNYPICLLNEKKINVVHPGSDSRRYWGKF